MGLSIHYSGRIKEIDTLSNLISEIKEISGIYSWQYSVFGNSFPSAYFGKDIFDDNIYGICFSPPECEPVFITFLSNGRMASPINLKFYGNSTNEKEMKYLYFLSTKTQHAGVETHKLIIHLFRYLENKYLLDFKMFDEGKYWETNDELVLEESFTQYNLILNNFSNALKSYPRNEDESYDQYFKRLMNYVHKKKKK